MQVALSVAKEDNNFIFETIGRYPNLQKALEVMSIGAEPITFDKQTGVFRNTLTNHLFKVRNKFGREICPSRNTLIAAKIKDQKAMTYNEKQEEKTVNEADGSSFGKTDPEHEFKIDWLHKESRHKPIYDGLSIRVSDRSMAFYCEKERFAITPFFEIGFIEGASIRIAIKFSKENTPGSYKLTLGKKESCYRSSCSTLIEKIKQKMLAYKIVKKDTFQGQKNEKMGCYILSLV